MLLIAFLVLAAAKDNRGAIVANEQRFLAQSQYGGVVSPQVGIHTSLFKLGLGS